MLAVFFVTIIVINHGEYILKKLINDPKNVVHEMLRGLTQAHLELVKPHGLNSIIYESNIRNVILLSGGGSGHEPLDLGYVGHGLLDGAIVGEPFTPPSVEQIVRTAKCFGEQKNILFIVKNFEEDIKNFTAAVKQLNLEDYDARIIRVEDDASIDPNTKVARNRGVAGTVIIHKMLGAAADQGMNIDELIELGNNINQNLYTLGVALTGSELPNQNQPSFELQENEIFYGIGIHGEEGYRREEFKSSELLGRELVNKLVQISQVSETDTIVILINSLGNLPMMENLIFTNDIVKLLQLKAINPVLVKTGNFLSSYNMNGISVTLLKVHDDKWIEYLNEECGGFAWY